jgi:hypothetical protein
MLAEAEVIEALVLFKRARLDDEQHAAEAATPGPWEADGGSVIVGHPTDYVVDFARDASAEHIARQHPAKTLRRIAAVRRVLDLVTFADGGGGYTEAYRDVVRLLGLEHAGHPGYREEWKP